MKYVAHIRQIVKNKNKINIEQSVKDHCGRVAALAAVRLSSIGLYYTAYLAGLLHDMGKLTKWFTEYIRSCYDVTVVNKPKKVIHSTIALKFIHDRWKLDGDLRRSTTIEILEIATGGHHGIFNIINADGNCILGVKENKTDEKFDAAYTEACNEIEENLCTLSNLDKLFELAVEEVSAIMNRLKEEHQKAHNKVDFREELAYYSQLLAKVVLSAVMDADKQETISFMSTEIEDFRELTESSVDAAYNQFTAYIGTLKKTEKYIDKVRGAILHRALAFANRDDIGNGIRRLDVPTGGGKTLTSLGYALMYAKKHKKQRIIFVIPYMSIIEQNSAEIQKALGGTLTVLEHHSNVTGNTNDEGELRVYKTLADTWGCEVIITTQVQFMNTFFKVGTSHLRRLNAVMNSVIILDEVQTMSLGCLGLFNYTLNFLKRVGNCEIVLSSATMPCFSKDYLPLYVDNVNGNIVELTAEEKGVFDRTTFINHSKVAKSADMAVDYVKDIAEKEGSTLMICNLRPQVRNLYKKYVEKYGEDGVYFLTTDLCTKHRMKVIEDIKERLNKKEKTICFCTPLIECGVDFSFNSVIRCLAGMDNLIQSAGRCNRNGELNRLGNVYVICLDDENLKIPQLKVLDEKYLAMLSALVDIRDLNNPQIIEQYYRHLHNLDGRNSDAFLYKIKYPITEGIRMNLAAKLNDKDILTAETSATLYEWCTTAAIRKSLNEKYKGYKLSNKFVIATPYVDVGEAFEMIDTNTVSILINYDKESSDYIEELKSENEKGNTVRVLSLFYKIHRYSVDVYDSVLDKLKKLEVVERIGDTDVYILKDGYYDKNMGLQLE